MGFKSLRLLLPDDKSQQHQILQRASSLPAGLGEHSLFDVLVDGEGHICQVILAPRKREPQRRWGTLGQEVAIDGVTVTIGHLLGNIQAQQSKPVQELLAALKG